MAKKILVVEDEAITALDLKYALQDIGYEIIGIEDNGPEAIDTAYKTHPDVVIMDIKLKGSMEGTEAAEIITQFDIPIVYLTANTDIETFKRSKIQRYYGFVPKPYDLRKLDKTLKITMEKFRLESIALKKANHLA